MPRRRCRSRAPPERHNPAERSALSHGRRTRRRAFTPPAVFSPAADAIGSEFDPPDRQPCRRRADARVLRRGLRLPVGALAAGGERVRLRGTTPDRGPSICAAHRNGRAGGLEGLLPVGEVIVFPRGTPYTRATATLETQLLDTVDAHTSARLSTSGGGDARMDVLLRTASFLCFRRITGIALSDSSPARGGPDWAPFLPAEAEAVELWRRAPAWPGQRAPVRTRTPYGTRHPPSPLPPPSRCSRDAVSPTATSPPGMTTSSAVTGSTTARSGGRVSLIVGSCRPARSGVGRRHDPAAHRRPYPGGAGHQPGRVDAPSRRARPCQTPGSFLRHVHVRRMGREAPYLHLCRSRPSAAAICDPGGQTGPVTLTSPGLPSDSAWGRTNPPFCTCPTRCCSCSTATAWSSPATPTSTRASPASRAFDTDGEDPDRVTGPDTLELLRGRLLRGTSATNDGADDRTLLLTELVPAKSPPPPQESESSPIACHPCLIACRDRVRSCPAVVHGGHEGGSLREVAMLVLGIILLVVGFVTGISILWTIGVILAVIGLVLWILGAAGHAVGGRRHYW